MESIMNIGGAIYSAGDRKLTEFTWGPTVVGIVNAFADDELHIDLDMSGLDVAKVIVQLTDAEEIFKIDLNTDHSLDHPNEEKATGKNITLMVLSGAMIMIAGWVLYTFVRINMEGKEMQDSPTLEAIINAIVEILRIFTTNV